jgi:transposase
VEVAANFPKECRYVLEMLGQAYGHDAEAREQALMPEQRLRFHQERSGSVMDQLHRWLEAQLAERRTEPNSGLAKAITYLLWHWRPSTLFLPQAGAPLDNNVVGRSLERAVLHRKNALFYRTLNGAQVGDLFMCLIHTCQLCGANSFDYLIELQRHAGQLAANPIERMPWNYRETRPGSMMIPTPPRRIDCGHGWVTLRNGCQTGLCEGKIRPRFWPATETGENVPRRTVRPSFHKRSADITGAEPCPAGVCLPVKCAHFHLFLIVRGRVNMEHLSRMWNEADRNLDLELYQDGWQIMKTGGGKTGRPISFDKDVALEAAMLLFWERGYEGTSMADLTRAMGLSPSSIYAAFGDKQALFFLTVKRYMDSRAKYATRALEEPTLERVIRALFENTVAFLTTPEHPPTCMTLAGAMGSSVDGTPARDLMTEIRKQNEVAMRQRLLWARKSGELSSDINVDDYTRYLSSILAGLSIQAANGSTKAELKRTAEMALQYLGY